MDYFKHNFNSDEWVVYLIDDSDEIISDKNTAAEVKFDTKELYVRRSEVTLKNVLHELWHIFFAYCYLSDTNDMTLGDIEEVSASLFADKCEMIVTTAKLITKKLEELKANQGANSEE